MKLDVKKLGLAFGLTYVGFYLACVLFMTIASAGAVILFFNSLMHGVDVTSIIRTEVSLGETFFGLISIFVLGWIMGVAIGWIYNLNFKK
jgi:hypothetical protein